MQRAEPDNKLWHASHHPFRLMPLPAGKPPPAQYSRNKAEFRRLLRDGAKGIAFAGADAAHS